MTLNIASRELDRPRVVVHSMRRRRGYKDYLKIVGGILVFVIFAGPYSVMLLNALRPNGEVLAIPPSYWPQTFTIQPFVEVLTDPRFQAWLQSSLIVAIASTLVVTILVVPTAYFTARHEFKGKSLFIGVVVATQMFSPTTLAVGIYREFFDLGLINTYTALIITDSAFNLAFALWIMHSFFSGVPKEIEEAALIDGASKLQVLTRVILPLVKPGLVTAVIFTFIATWNEFIIALTLMQADDKKTLTVGINSYVTGYEQHWSQLFAAAVLAIFPIVILFALIEKHLVGGMTAGAVK